MSSLVPRPPSIFRRAVRILAWGTFGGTVVSALGILGFGVASGEAFMVQQVVIVGNIRAESSQLRHLSDIHSDDHLFSVDLDRAVRGVERHPWVKSATAMRRIPGVVEITVTEHEPVMLLATGELWYVNERGQPFKQARSDDLDYPVLTGLDPDMAEEHPEIAAAVVFGGLRVLGSLEDDPTLSAEDVSEVHFDTNQGFELVLRSGTRLVLGLNDPVPRMARLALLTRSGLDLSTPQRVDLDVETVAIATPLDNTAVSQGDLSK